MELNKYYEFHMRYNPDFKVIMSKFSEMIKIDNKIMRAIPDKNYNQIKKNGLTSFAIKYLISNYVNNNREAFLRLNRKELEKVETQNINNQDESV